MINLDITINDRYYYWNNIKLKNQIKEIIQKLTKITYDLFNPEESWEISVIFNSEHQQRYLNKTYRNKYYLADVLSFPQELFLKSNNLKEEKNKIILGDISISLIAALSQSEEYGHSLKYEIAFLFVHGLLHLLGFDHVKTSDYVKMESLEQKILKKDKNLFLIHKKERLKINNGQQ